MLSAPTKLLLAAHMCCFMSLGQLLSLAAVEVNHVEITTVNGKTAATLKPFLGGMCVWVMDTEGLEEWPRAGWGLGRSSHVQGLRQILRDGLRLLTSEW